MAPSRDFNQTVVARAQRDASYAIGLLEEAISALLDGEPAVARLLLRNLINGTIGFEPLAVEIDIPSKSLHRMLSARGNPSMNNLTVIIGALRQRLGVDLNIQSVPSKALIEASALEGSEIDSLGTTPYESVLPPRAYEVYEKAYHHWSAALAGPSEVSLSKDTFEGIKAFTLIATLENHFRTFPDCSSDVYDSWRLLHNVPRKQHVAQSMQYPTNELDRLAQAAEGGIRTLSKSLKLDLVFDDFPFFTEQIKDELNKELDEKINELTTRLNSVKESNSWATSTVTVLFLDPKAREDRALSRDRWEQCSEQVASLIRVLSLERDKHNNFD